MRKNLVLFYQMRTVLIGAVMFITGVIFLCYMGSSLIRSTEKYKEQTMQVAQKMNCALMEE